MIEFAFHGQPCPKGRPKFGRGVTYTPARTEQAEEAVRQAWMVNGRQRIDGDRTPLVLDVECIFARPPDHYLKDDTLSAKGLREPYPHGHGDWDNLGKLVSDALNGLAYSDDAQVVLATVRKRWAGREVARTIISVKAARVFSEERAAA